MARVIFGNHSSVIVPQQDRDSIRKFYCDVLDGKIMKADPERDFIRLGKDFYIGFLYGDVPDVSEFLRTARSVWLEIKSDNVEEMRRKILESDLVRKLEVPDPHLYFQAPGGQCLRLVGINEDLSFYEGAGEGPDVAKIKEALRAMDVKDELSKLKGTWIRVFEGKAHIINFDGEKVARISEFGDRTSTIFGTIAIDPTKNPKYMDWKISQGIGGGEKFTGKTVLTIYEIEGDTFKFCGIRGQEARPETFPNKEEIEGNYFYLVYKRLK